MSSETPPVDEAEATRFSDFLEEHNSGKSDNIASDALRRLVEAVRETGKKGSVTVKVDVAPLKDAEGMVTVTVNVAEKLPITPPRPAIFFTDDDGNLSRRDPSQRTLFDEDVRSTPSGPAPDEVKELDGDAGRSNVRDLGARVGGGA